MIKSSFLYSFREIKVVQGAKDMLMPWQVMKREVLRVENKIVELRIYW